MAELLWREEVRCKTWIPREGPFLTVLPMKKGTAFSFAQGILPFLSQNPSSGGLHGSPTHPTSASCHSAQPHPSCVSLEAVDASPAVPDVGAQPSPADSPFPFQPLHFPLSLGFSPGICLVPSACGLGWNSKCLCQGVEVL